MEDGGGTGDRDEKTEDEDDWRLDSCRQMEGDEEEDEEEDEDEDEKYEQWNLAPELPKGRPL